MDYNDITKPDKDVINAFEFLSKILKFEYHYDVKKRKGIDFYDRKFNIQNVFHVIDFSNTCKCSCCDKFNFELLSDTYINLFKRFGFSFRKDGRIIFLQNPYANKMILKLKEEIDSMRE